MTKSNYRLCLTAAATFISLKLLAGDLNAAVANKPLTPEQERQSFVLADSNLIIELVAREPDIVAPVSMAFDADGRMFVTEMTDYPSGPGSGRISSLRDADGDGYFEKASLFADGLSFPTGLMPWNGGLLVTAAPDIWFLKDTNNDGRADERRKLLTGFAEGNQQLRVNGLFWGLDNWIYGANGRSDGEVRWSDLDQSHLPVSIRRRDFRFRPDSHQFQAVSGHSQFGLAHDDWGNRFPVFNNIPIRHIVIEERYLNRQPALAGSENVVPISARGDTGAVFPLTPTSLLIPQAPGFFTSACGLIIFRGDALGSNYYGDAFVCEPAQNLVQRRRLVTAGATFVAERATGQQEFLAASDPWFHPVNLQIGPDGALYLVDFYRQYVEHPHWVAEAVRTNTSWKTGSEHGRIWRIRGKNSRRKTDSPQLTSATTAALAGALTNQNSWWRETAQRLIVERQDRTALPLLKAMVREAPSPATGLHALYAVEGLGGLDKKLLSDALRDSSPHVREHAIYLSESSLSDADLRAALFTLVNDSDDRVRLQLALTLGEIKGDTSYRALAALARKGIGDHWQTLAVLSSVGERPWLFLKEISNSNWLFSTSAGENEFLEKLGLLIGARSNEADLVACLSWFSASAANIAPRLILLSGVTAGFAQANKSFRDMLTRPTGSLTSVVGALTNLLTEAAAAAVDVKLDPPVRVAAIRVLGAAQTSQAGKTLIEVIKAYSSEAVQLAAAKAVIESKETFLIAQAFRNWNRFSKATRRYLVSTAPQSPIVTEALLDAIEQGTVSPLEIDPATRNGLRKNANAEIQKRVKSLLSDSVSGDREQVVQSFRGALDLAGDGRRGGAVFAKTCMICHAVRGQGAAIGPDLSGIASHSKETLLVEILDPSRQVLPDYVSYTVETTDEETITGFLAGESAAAVTLRRPNQPDAAIQRSRIKRLQPDGKSLMPDGLESGLTAQDLADLLEFLQFPDRRFLPNSP